MVVFCLWFNGVMVVEMVEKESGLDIGDRWFGLSHPGE